MMPTREPMRSIGTCSMTEWPTPRTPGAWSGRIERDRALVELWRTAPYLHDGSAVSLRDILTTCNPNDRHGHTSGLAPQEIDDLVESLLSL